MKKIMSIVLGATAIAWGACNADGQYVDLNTGEKIRVEKDPETGYMVNAETGKPVYLYVDVDKKDTLYGRTGSKVNGRLAKNSGRWEYDSDGEYKYVNGDYKKKIDDDGSWKVKDGDYKKKVDEDGDIKIKDGDTKIKIDGKTGEMKVKKD